MKNIVIIGTGGHAKVIFDILLRQNLYKPVAFLSLNDIMTSFLGLPHYHQSKLDQKDFNTGVLAIGDNFVRSQAAEFVRSQKPKFNFITAIHPSAQIAEDVILGEGSVVMANVVVNPGTYVGSHAILNTSSSVDHDCKIGQFASIAPGCTLGGNVEVGEFSAVSLGSKIIHSKKIGSHSVIGAGALVLKDIESYKVAYGHPCQIVRSRTLGEKYL